MASGGFVAGEQAHCLNDFGFGPGEEHHLNSDRYKANQMNAVLVYNRSGKTICVGNINPDPTGRLTAIQLLTRINKKYCCLKLSMTCNLPSPEAPSVVSVRHDILLRLRWVCRDFSYHEALDDEKQELVQSASSRSLAQDFVGKSLFCLGFSQVDDEYPFAFKEAGTPCANREACPTQHVISSLIDGHNLRLFFHEQDIVLGFKSWVANNNLGTWSDCPHQDHGSIPEAALRQWPGNTQNSMASGLADLASTMFFNGALRNGPRTALDQLPLARSLRHFFNTRYEDVTHERPGNTYPLFLDVIHGECSSERLVNEDNVAISIGLVEEMLQSVPLLRSSDIGIITIYGSQVKMYSSALKRLNSPYPDRDYTNLQVGTVEWWHTRRAEVVIFDMVRTGTDKKVKSEYLFQEVRLQIALTSHCQGLVLVGASKCLKNTTNWAGPKAEKTFAEKNKMLADMFGWLLNRGRRVVINHNLRSVSAVTSPTPALSVNDARDVVTENDLSVNPLKIPIDTFGSNRTHSDSSHLSEGASRDSRITNTPNHAESHSGFNHLNSIEPSANTVESGDGEVTSEPKRARVCKLEPTTPPMGLPVVSAFDLPHSTPETKTLSGYRSKTPAGRSFQGTSFFCYVFSK